MKKKIVFSVCLIISLIGCANEKPKSTVTKVPVVGELTAKSVAVSDTEKVIIVDVPDYYAPRRCVIYASPHGSNMDCSFNADDNATVISAVRNTD